MDLPELSRLIENLLRFGTVESVDHAAGLCVVRSGALVLRPMPWIVPRAGDARTWWAPSVGEQIMVLCPGGDTTRGGVLPALYSNASPRPDGADTANVTQYGDGAVISYDPAAHALSATLPDGATAKLVASGGVAITGDTTITGKLTVTKDTDLQAKLHVADDVSADTKVTANTDVLGGGISLKNHTHPGVMSGGAVTGPPE